MRHDNLERATEFFRLLGTAVHDPTLNSEIALGRFVAAEYEYFTHLMLDGPMTASTARAMQKIVDECMKRGAEQEA